jgi:hypothetical protein
LGDAHTQVFQSLARAFQVAFAEKKGRLPVPMRRIGVSGVVLEAIGAPSRLALDGPYAPATGNDLRYIDLIDRLEQDDFP